MPVTFTSEEWADLERYANTFSGAMLIAEATPQGSTKHVRATQMANHHAQLIAHRIADKADVVRTGRKASTNGGN